MDKAIILHPNISYFTNNFMLFQGHITVMVGKWLLQEIFKPSS
jgi:hypothetical protein